MNQILHADDAIVTKRSNNQRICQGNSLLVAFAITMRVDRLIYWLQVWVPPVMYGSTILSMLIETLLSFTKVPLKIWQRRRSCNTLQTFGLTPLIPLILVTNASLGSTGTLMFHVSSFSWHPSHSNLNSVHLPVYLVTMLSCFIDKLPPCLSKHLLGKLLS